jgi:hypothetical protein
MSDEVAVQQRYLIARRVKVLSKCPFAEYYVVFDGDTTS